MIAASSIHLSISNTFHKSLQSEYIQFWTVSWWDSNTLLEYITGVLPGPHIQVGKLLKINHSPFVGIIYLQVVEATHISFSGLVIIMLLLVRALLFWSQHHLHSPGTPMNYSLRDCTSPHLPAACSRCSAQITPVNTVPKLLDAVYPLAICIIVEHNGPWPWFPYQAVDQKTRRYKLYKVVPLQSCFLVYNHL